MYNVAPVVICLFSLTQLLSLRSPYPSSLAALVRTDVCSIHSATDHSVTPASPFQALYKLSVRDFRNR